MTEDHQGGLLYLVLDSNRDTAKILTGQGSHHILHLILEGIGVFHLMESCRLLLGTHHDMTQRKGHHHHCTEMHLQTYDTKVILLVE